MYNNEFLQNMNMENIVDGNNNYINNDMNVDFTVNNNGMNGVVQQPIGEGVQEKVVHRTFVHEVPQDCFFMIEK